MNTIKATELRIGNLIQLFLGVGDNGAEYREYAIRGIMIDLVGAEHHLIGNTWVHLSDNFAPIPLTEEWLVKFGLKKIPHLTVTNSYTLDIGRNRIVSVCNIGTPNEMIWLCQINDKDKNKIDDLICLRNYDYDGYTHVHTFQNLIHSLTGLELTLPAN
jgi:hypothetical protein